MIKRANLVHLLLPAFFAAIFLFAAFDSLSFPFLAQIFPLAAALAGLAILLAELLWLNPRAPVAGPFGEDASDGDAFLDRVKAGVPYLAWILGYYVLIYLAGFLVATALFIFLFLRHVARLRIAFALFGATAAVGAVYVFGAVLSLKWPEGILMSAIPF